MRTGPRWLRWIDDDGNLIPTGRNAPTPSKCARRRRTSATQNAPVPMKSASVLEAERTAPMKSARAERLAAQLRAAGIEPE
ncbi:MAG: hypothetical protein R2911_11945 [Caldilineaceae bacterium]